MCVGEISIEIPLFKLYSEKVYFSIFRRYNMTTSPFMTTRVSSINSMHYVLHIHVSFLLMLSLKKTFRAELREHDK